VRGTTSVAGSDRGTLVGIHQLFPGTVAPLGWRR
jgi:hypothetical protein